MTKRKLFTSILAAILLLCVGQVGWKLHENSARSREYEKAAVIAGLVPETQGETAVPPSVQADQEEPEALPDETPPLTSIDLEALRAVNPEVAGWIEIPGTKVSYPVLRSGDNRYYLNHTWTGQSNSGGAIFLEQTSQPDLAGFHTILYGHRMRDGSMFGSLKNYRDTAYWQEHPSVYLAWDGEVYRYDIFSAHEAGVEGLVYRMDLEVNGLEEEFLQECVGSSVIDTGIFPEAGDRILTLSTCTGSGYAARWVVQGVLTDHSSAK